MQPGRIEIRPVEYELCAQGPHGRHLVGIGVLGETDHGLDAKQLAGAGHGLAVIAG